jgi:hypothetical protein
MIFESRKKVKTSGKRSNLAAAFGVSMKGGFMRQIRLLAASLAFGCVAFAADPQLMNMVMPDAKILAGINASNARISPFGQFVISKVAMLGVEPRKFIEATGFDPLQDVVEVLAASTADPAKLSVLLLARGTFNVEKIVAAVSTMPNVQVTATSETTILTLTDPKTKTAHAVAFLGNSVAVAGDLASVQTALAQNAAPSPNTIDPALAAEVNKLSTTQDEWLASSVSVASLIPANATAPSGPAGQVLPVLKSIQAFNGGINFTSTVQLTGEVVTSDPQNAVALSGVLKLGVMLVSMAAQNQGSANNPQLAALAQLLQTMAVSTNGPAVDVSLAIPEAQAEGFVNSVFHPASPAVSPDAQPRRRLNGN